MTDINSAFYLYDSNGKTIGYKTADSNLKDYDATAGERENPSGHVGGDTRETYYYNGEWWTICDASALELCSTEEELYKKLSEILDNGVTVEQLSVDQITSLFINGDLTVGELEKGLFSKEGFSSKDWDLQQNDDWTIAKFTINGKKYSIKCVTEQCNAQTDLWHTDADIKHALAQGQYGYLQRYEGQKNLDEETQYAIQRAKQKQTAAFHEQNRQ